MQDCSWYLAVSSCSSSSDGGMPVDDRMTSNDWCSCTHCERMPTVDECKCCREMANISHRMVDLECITKHEKFPIICLDVDVLEVGLLSMRDNKTSMDECKCCRETGDISHRMVDLECITKHQKFPIICLDVDVLEVGLLSMRDLRTETLMSSR